MRALSRHANGEKAIIAPVHRMIISRVAIIALVLVIGAGIARAEVKLVQMKIAGYLCGN